MVDYYEASALSIDTSLKQVFESAFSLSLALALALALTLALAYSLALSLTYSLSLSLALSLSLFTSLSMQGSLVYLQKARKAVSDVSGTPSWCLDLWLHPLTFRLLYILQILYMSCCLKHTHTPSLSYTKIHPPPIHTSQIVCESQQRGADAGPFLVSYDYLVVRSLSLSLRCCLALARSLSRAFSCSLFLSLAVSL